MQYCLTRCSSVRGSLGQKGNLVSSYSLIYLSHPSYPKLFPFCYFFTCHFTSWYLILRPIGHDKCGDYRGHAPALVLPLVGGMLGQIGFGSGGRLHTDCHKHCIPWHVLAVLVACPRINRLTEEGKH